MADASEHFEMIVIGGGPAGVVAALRARELGASTALVERGRMGGVCTNDGCVPTRVLARAARLRREADQFETYGLLAPEPELDFGRLMARAQQVVYQVHEKKQLLKHLRGAGVRVFDAAGSARFLDPHTIQLEDGSRLRGDEFILCVGGHARRITFPGSELAITHSDIWGLRELPESMAIVGAAATGCQLASIFAAFGTRVTLLEIAPRILAIEDQDLSQAVAQAFERRGIRLVNSIAGIERLERDGQGLNLVYRQDDQTLSLQAEVVVLAVGWVGNLEGLNLEAAGVETERGYIRVSDTLQTSAAHIFAAGDITGRMMLVQSANYDGRAAAENAVLNADEFYKHHIVPHGGFTDPEYGSVGLTEAQARQELGEDGYASALVPYSDMDRAVIDGHTTGFCKLVVNRASQLVVGAHVVGEQALEVVQLLAAGMAAGMTVDQLADLEIAYPTYAGVAGLAARRIAPLLGLTPLAPEWRVLSGGRLAEWERRDQ